MNEGGRAVGARSKRTRDGSSREGKDHNDCDDSTDARESNERGYKCAHNISE